MATGTMEALKACYFLEKTKAPCEAKDAVFHCSDQRQVLIQLLVSIPSQNTLLLEPLSPLLLQPPTPLQVHRLASEKVQNSIRLL